MNRSLYDALQSEVARGEREAIAKAATDLSRRYRTGRPGSDGRFAKTNSDIQAYAAFRMPATYAALCAALGEVKARLSPLSPRTLLDAGSGPGTAMWAATAVWPEIEQCTLIEREPEMIVLGKRLATYSELDAVRRATWIRQTSLPRRTSPVPTWSSSVVCPWRDGGGAIGLPCLSSLESDRESLGPR